MRKLDTKTYKLASIPIISGLLIAIATFSSWWFVQLIAFVALAPLFVVMKLVNPKHYYFFGLLFFAAWLLPTTCWYYNFMPWWLAVLASVGFVTLIANVFHLFSLSVSKKVSYPVALVCVIVAWVAFTWLRIRLPVSEDWWIPHLGYAAWHNSGVLQTAHFGGEVTVEAVVLLANAAIALAYIYGNKYRSAIVSLAIICIVSASNLLILSRSSAPLPNVISLQQMTTGGVDVPATNVDITLLIKNSAEALKQAPSNKPTVVVWPENSIPVELQEQIKQFASSARIFIVYHTVEKVSDKTYKKVVVLDDSGKELLRNYKQHIAPGEIGDSNHSDNSAQINDWLVTTYACYDMHYPDSVRRIGNADIVFVPINDAAFGTLQRNFHAADLAFRAVQTNATIVSSSTNGPTVYIDEWGVKRRDLPYSSNGSIMLF